MRQTGGSQFGTERQVGGRGDCSSHCWNLEASVGESLTKKTSAAAGQRLSNHRSATDSVRGAKPVAAGAGSASVARVILGRGTSSGCSEMWEARPTP